MTNLDNGHNPELARIAFMLHTQPWTGAELDKHINLILGAIRVAEKLMPNIGFAACADAVSPDHIASQFEGPQDDDE
jgi:hypothetical protein